MKFLLRSLWQAARLPCFAMALGACLPAPAEDTTRGQALARQYCGSCHLFPEPKLLTKTEWAHHVLPQMALWLGVEKADYENLPDGRILQEASIFPPSPLLPQEDWFAIWDYYVKAAPTNALRRSNNAQAPPASKLFRAHKWNFHAGMPMISLLKIDPTQKCVWVGDALAGILAKVDATGKPLMKTRTPSPPVSVASGGDGLYVALIGSMFPSDAAKGKVIFLPQKAGAPPALLDVLPSLRRPTHLLLADLNQDKQQDLIVCSFGNRLGGFSWFEQGPPGSYKEQALIDQPGAVRARLHDFNRDGKMDIAVLMAQGREALHLFSNLGQGRFEIKTVIEQHPAFGFAGFELADFNRDGHIDIVTANGDNGDFPTPHKDYHGIRIYLNDGMNSFKEAWSFAMEGAYDARPADFDNDGDIDLAAIAFYPDFENPNAPFALYFENKGNLRFEPFSVPESKLGRWLTTDSGDLDGDGDIDLVLGSFALGPTTIPVPASVKEEWKSNGAAVLFLENLIKTP